jgi:citrate synthase
LDYRDGKRGTILFRGHTIEELWHCEFEDLAHLMVWGRLPSPVEKKNLREDLMAEMLVIPQCVIDAVRAFP